MVDPLTSHKNRISHFVLPVPIPVSFHFCGLVSKSLIKILPLYNIITIQDWELSTVCITPPASKAGSPHVRLPRRLLLVRIRCTCNKSNVPVQLTIHSATYELMTRSLRLKHVSSVSFLVLVWLSLDVYHTVPIPLRFSSTTVHAKPYAKITTMTETGCCLTFSCFMGGRWILARPLQHNKLGDNALPHSKKASAALTCPQWAVTKSPLSYLFNDPNPMLISKLQLEYKGCERVGRLLKHFWQ